MSHGIMHGIKTAKCSKPWGQMTGDDRKRYCDDCGVTILRVEGLNESGVTELVSNSMGGHAFQLCRRRDGTLATGTGKPCGFWQFFQVTVVPAAILVASWCSTVHFFLAPTATRDNIHFLILFVLSMIWVIVDPGCISKRRADSPGKVFWFIFCFNAVLSTATAIIQNICLHAPSVLFVVKVAFVLITMGLTCAFFVQAKTKKNMKPASNNAPEISNSLLKQ